MRATRASTSARSRRGRDRRPAPRRGAGMSSTPSGARCSASTSTRATRASWWPGTARCRGSWRRTTRCSSRARRRCSPSSPMPVRWRQPAPTPTLPPGEEAHSSHEDLLVYLRSIEGRGEGLPTSFLEHLRRALGHYGIGDLEPTAELREALLWLAKARERLGAAASGDPVAPRPPARTARAAGPTRRRGFPGDPRPTDRGHPAALRRAVSQRARGPLPVLRAAGVRRSGGALLRGGRDPPRRPRAPRRRGR